jgi:hypothetical protein
MFRKIKVAVFMFTVFSSGSVLSAECKSAQDIHQEKMDKYKLPELPSLLESCGIGGILGGWLDLGSLNLDLDNLFCGYGANDLGNMYGGVSGSDVNLPDEINLDGQIGVDVGWGAGAENGIGDGNIVDQPSLDIIGAGEDATDITLGDINYDELFPSNINATEESDTSDNNQ